MSFRPFTDIWILARPKVKYFGAYPAGFLQRARDLIACGANDQVLHVCSGEVRLYRCGPGCPGKNHSHGFGIYDLTFDLDRNLNPDIVGDARNAKDYRCAIEQAPQIQGVLADPPYNYEFAKSYAVGPDVLPTPNEIVKHSIDILPIGGRVGMLSMHWPRYPKKNARQIAIIGVLVGNGNIGRWFSVFEKTK